MRSLLARGNLFAASACMALSTGLCAPTGASAQNANPPPAANAPSYGDCQQHKVGGAILGSLIGAVVGGVIGSNIAANGHKGDGTAVGAGVFGVGGGVVGYNAASCGPGPQTYYDNGAYRQGYADRNVRYGQPSPTTDAGAPPPPSEPDSGYQDAPPPAQPPGAADPGYNDAPPNSGR